MNSFLQTILIVGSILFFVYIINMIRSNKLDLRYALTWIAASGSFAVLSIFPGILKALASCINIVEPVNALYLIVILFLLIIAFTTTITAAKNARRVRALQKSLDSLKVDLERLKVG